MIVAIPMWVLVILVVVSVLVCTGTLFFVATIIAVAHGEFYTEQQNLIHERQSEDMKMQLRPMVDLSIHERNLLTCFVPSLLLGV